VQQLASAREQLQREKKEAEQQLRSQLDALGAANAELEEKAQFLEDEAAQRREQLQGAASAAAAREGAHAARIASLQEELDAAAAAAQAVNAGGAADISKVMMAMQTVLKTISAMCSLSNLCCSLCSNSGGVYDVHYGSHHTCCGEGQGRGGATIY